MKLYGNNGKSWHLSTERIARGFLTSRYAAETDEPLDLRLAAFIANELGSTWDDNTAFARVQNRVIVLIGAPS